MEKLDTSSSKKTYPAFVLNLSCQLSEYDITFEATKTYVEFKDWTPVLKFVENVLRASWGDEEGRRQQALQAIGKRRSWCRSDCARESSLETKWKSKRARTQTVDDEVSAGPLQDDSVSMPQLGSKSLGPKGGNVGIGECTGGARDGRYHFGGDGLETGTSCTWGQLAKPALVKEEVGWLDPEISTPPLMDIQNRHSIPDCSSPDTLQCLSSPDLSMPSSPVLSEGSWDSRFKACYGPDDFALEVSSANTDYGELQPAFHCLGSDPSDVFQGIQYPRPLRAKEPWVSPDRDSDSMISLLEGEMSDWTLPTVPSSMNVLLFPGCSSFHELDMDELNSEGMATESCADVEEAQFHRHLHRWSDSFEKPSRQAHDYAPELRQELILSGESPFDCSTNPLTEVGKGQEGDRRKVISLDEIDNAIQGHSNLQPEWTCTSLVEASEHDLALSKFRSSDKGSVLPDEDLAPVASLYKVWSNPCMRANVSDILDVSAGILESCNKPLQPDMVTKESLQHARVLQQVDTKFIVIVAQSVLLLVDQHAADERVRLEEFRAEVLAAGKKQCSTSLNVKHDLALGLGEQQTLHAYRKQIEDWGWRIQPGSDAQSFDRNLLRNGTTCNLQLTAVPCILGVDLTATDLIEYLQQLGATQGASVPPPAVVRLLNYKSCRGAIMFGDPLLPAECRQLVSHLKRTSLCFQCAHGRPTMVPLVNLQNLRQQFEPHTLNDEIVCTQTSMREAQTRWHKLIQRPPSLVRARERLHHQ